MLVEDAFKTIYLEKFGRGEINFIPFSYLTNDLYPNMSIDFNGHVIDNDEPINLLEAVTYEDNSLERDDYREPENPLDNILRDELIDYIDETIETSLNSIEEAVIRMRFGLTDFRSDLTLEQIGKELSITRERVRQIESSGIKKLKHPKCGIFLKCYIEENEERIKDTYTNKELYERFRPIAKYWSMFLINKKEIFEEVLLKNIIETYKTNSKEQLIISTNGIMPDKLLSKSLLEAGVYYHVNFDYNIKMELVPYFNFYQVRIENDDIEDYKLLTRNMQLCEPRHAYRNSTFF